MIPAVNINKRAQNAENLKQKLITATDYLIKEYDFETMTIRNLCSVSGVSSGSFYNIFESKEKFLVYYLTTDFVKFKTEHYQSHREFENLSPLNKVIDIYKCCGLYNEFKGIDFIRSFYSPRNLSLYPSKININQVISFTPLIEESLLYLNQSVEMGELPKDSDLYEISKRFCYLFNGVTFNWCVSDQEFSLVDELGWLFSIYINTIK